SRCSAILTTGTCATATRCSRGTAHRTTGRRCARGSCAQSAGRYLSPRSDVTGASRATSPGPPVDRPPLWPVFVAYGVAFLAVLAAGTVYVLVSAIPRSGWDPVRLAHEAAKFAFSAPGLLGV